MEAFTYKGISDGKYVQGDIEAINLDEASHLLKEQKIFYHISPLRKKLLKWKVVLLPFQSWESQNIIG